MIYVVYKCKDGSLQSNLVVNYPERLLRRDKNLVEIIGAQVPHKVESIVGIVRMTEPNYDRFKPITKSPITKHPVDQLVQG